MQSTDARHLHHPALAPHLHTPRLGCVLSQRQMCARPIVVVDVLRQDLAKVPFADHDDVVKAFPSNRADHPLGIRAPARSVPKPAMPTVTAWFTTAFALSTTAGGRFSKRRPATNSPSWTASGREAVDIAVSTVQHLARAEHLSDVEPLRAESLAPSWGEGVAPAARSAGGTGSALPRGRRGTTRGSIRGARRRPVVAALAGVSRCGAPGRWR